MNAAQSGTRVRMEGIDAARGVAMFFSCLAHFGWWIETPHPAAASLLANIGMVATPTFLLLSGVMTGWLCGTAGKDPTRTRFKILNRALFLLTFGHLFIALAEAHRNGGLLRTLTDATIVDEIGLYMLICAALFPFLRSSSTRRFMLLGGSVSFVACWLLVLAWHPAPGGWLILRQILLGPDPLGAKMHYYAAPTLQYACLFAMGLGSSDALVRAARNPDPGAGAYRVVRVGGAMIMSALGLRLVRWIAGSSNVDHALSPALDLTFTVAGKLPPTPAYVLFYTGVGLLAAGVLFRLAHADFASGRALVRVLAVVGQASLFVFILQYFVYWTLPDLVNVHPSSTRLVPIFLAGLALNWAGAWWWNRIRGNRFLTLGIRPPHRVEESGSGHGPGTQPRT